MKVAIITDTHYGFKKGSKQFHDYFELFYKNVFFPTLEQEGITTVIHMGDAFDSRKGIDYQSLDWAKRVVFDPLSKYDVHMIIGNHDTYYKNTNEVNSPQLLLEDYKNIKTYSNAKEVNIGGLHILLIPWINEDNEAETFKLIQSSNCKCAMGHLELSGFRVNKQIVMDHGYEGKLFEKFSHVFSGHYHTRSDDGRIFYLGNPYEMFWSDAGDRRGFTIFDTETLEHGYVNNPYTMFHLITYDDDSASLFDARDCKDKIVKVVVKNKKRPKEFDKFLDKIYNSGSQEVKIVENFQIIENDEDFVAEDEENTINILNRYIDESEINLDKSMIKEIFQNLYREAHEVS
jgi:predicted phosphodiesterase|tara:strand:- start:582 stop:1619 length:1038 start_codon:yes stop_codon:yes gene_type:complete